MLPPKDISVIIFGQDPYPRAESAIGQAFNDGAIHKWTDKFNPSFRNIMKNVMVGEGLMGKTDAPKKMIDYLVKNDIVDPPQWFEHTANNGVCWLNTSLTFTSTDLSHLKRHITFWAPIIQGILATLVNKKKEMIKDGTNTKAGLVFVLWGDHAKKLKAKIEALNNASEPKIALNYVECCHPSAMVKDGFTSVLSFDEVNKHLKAMELPTIKWLPKKSEFTSKLGSTTETKPAEKEKEEASDEVVEKSTQSKKRKADSSDEGPPAKKVKK